MRKHILTLASFCVLAALLLAGCASGSGGNTGTPNSPGNNETSGEAGVVISAALDQDALKISDNLFGLFLEDINFAVDAGLYAEMIKNRSFEYGSLASNENMHAWKRTGSGASMSVVSGRSDKSWLNSNNPHYAILSNSGTAMQGYYNTGYLDGLYVVGGDDYIASIYIRGTADVRLSLEGDDGTVYAKSDFTADSSDWHKYTVTLTPSATVRSDLRFAVRIGKGTVDIDMVSLMPADTFAGLPVRKDLGEALAATNPSFLRFPGGCVVEGKAEETMYHWKDSIGNAIDFYINGEYAVGDVAARPQTIDLWVGNSAHPYYCTYGLGFYEYFLLSEALDAIPLPILNAGMTCPIQSPNYLVYSVNSAEFKQYVQDALDLAEFCLGGADTEWGAVRIAMGHEEPFKLKYIGIGNEQWQSEYHQHYSRFVRAFEAAAKERPEIYGDIELIVANGPVSGSTEGWSYIRNNPDSITTLVDEHYYEDYAWFFNHTERYDSYNRSTQAKVFLGEYASRSNTMNSALAEAAYMTAIERNGDIVEMACYAPLFGNSTLNQWNPDMIYFSKDSINLTPNYYVQQMFGNNTGTEYITTTVDVDESALMTEFSGKVGLSSWMTSVSYDNLKVVSNDTGKVLYENDFNSSDSFDDFDREEGRWALSDGALVQSNTGSPANTNIGDAVYVGDADWTNYTMTVDAEILGGAEGFLIPICVQDIDNNIFWNIGGWGNTVSCLQIVSGGTKSDQVGGTVLNMSLKHNKVYHLKVVVSGNNIKCYIDDTLKVNYTHKIDQSVFASTVRDENGDVIVKVVNASDKTLPVVLNLPGVKKCTAKVTTLSAESGSAVNSFGSSNNIVPVESTMKASETTEFEAVPYSLTVIRIPAK